MRSMYGPASGTSPVIVTCSRHPQLGDQPRQRRCAYSGASAHESPPTSSTCTRVAALAQQRRGPHEAVLPLPRLQARDQADQQRSRRQHRGVPPAARRRRRGGARAPGSQPPPRTSAARGGSGAAPRPPRARCSRSPRPAARWRQRSSQWSLGIACCHHTTRSPIPASIAAGAPYSWVLATQLRITSGRRRRRTRPAAASPGRPGAARARGRPLARATGTPSARSCLRATDPPVGTRARIRSRGRGRPDQRLEHLLGAARAGRPRQREEKPQRPAGHESSLPKAPGRLYRVLRGTPMMSSLRVSPPSAKSRIDLARGSDRGEVAFRAGVGRGQRLGDRGQEIAGSAADPCRRRRGRPRTVSRRNQTPYPMCRVSSWWIFE